MALESVKSLAWVLEQMMQHQHVILEDRQLVESLLRELNSIQDILKNSSQNNSGEINYTWIRMIINSANHTKHFAESHIRDQLLPLGRAPEYIVISSQCLERLKSGIYLMKKEAMKIEGASRSSIAGRLEYGDPNSDATMVGFEDDFREIKQRLVKGSKQLQIAAVVGMGGIGKTTLATKVYNDSYISTHFDIQSWVTVSQSYNLLRILIDLLDSMKKLNQKGDIQTIKEHLYKSLKGRRYLIVMDDVWDSNLWDDLRQIFPNDHNSSRILLTTRLENVAIQANSCPHVHRMHLLNEDKSWNLFSHKVFGEDYPPLELEEIGKKIVQSCGGLPLAIIVLAGLLSKASRTQEDWRSFADNLSSETIQNDERCLKMVSLSYIHLPLRVQDCFLFTRIFPEDYDIPVSELVELWVAEGLIKHMDSKTLEDVAYDYLLDLIDRSLLMVGKLSTLGKVKECKIHDLVREFCIKEAKDNMLFHITDRSLYGIRVGAALRLLSVHKNVTNIFPCDERKVPSLSVSSVLIFDYDVYISTLFQNLGPLRVFKTVGMCHIKGEKNGLELCNMRFLCCHLEVFPITSSSVLQNLQTLILRGTNSDSLLEIEIWNMLKLRYVKVVLLKLNDPPGEESPAVLEHLQKLYDVQNIRCSKEVLKRIPNLKKLAICYSYIHKDGPPDFCLNNLVHLQKLEVLRIQLSYDSLPGRMPNLTLPHSLRKLSLVGWILARKDMQTIGCLPNLEVLKLDTCPFINLKWEPAEGEFLSLKYLKLHRLNLKHWKADSIYFQSLECLIIDYCLNLMEIPSGIGYIATLQLIELRYCTHSLIACVKEILEEQRESGNEDLQVHIQNSLKKFIYDPKE